MTLAIGPISGTALNAAIVTGAVAACATTLAAIPSPMKRRRREV